MGENWLLVDPVQDLLQVSDSTLPCFVNNQPLASYELGFLNMFLLSVNCFFQIIKGGVPVN